MAEYHFPPYSRACKLAISTDFRRRSRVAEHNVKRKQYIRLLKVLFNESTPIHVINKSYKAI